MADVGVVHGLVVFLLCFGVLVGRVGEGLPLGIFAPSSPFETFAAVFALRGQLF